MWLGGAFCPLIAPCLCRTRRVQDTFACYIGLLSEIGQAHLRTLWARSCSLETALQRFGEPAGRVSKWLACTSNDLASMLQIHCEQEDSIEISTQPITMTSSHSTGSTASLMAPAVQPPIGVWLF